MNHDFFIFDTNVICVAAGLHEGASKNCIDECISIIGKFLDKKFILVLDNNDLIIKEYTNKIDPNDKKVSSVNYNFAKMFIINLRQKQWNSSFIKRVSITPTNLEKTEFKEFPDDPDLAKFEPDDKKFIAVACQFQKENLGIKSPVVEAADTDFLHYKDVLKKHVVEIEFICPDMIQEFKRRKDEKNIKGKTKIINRKKKK